MRKIVVFPVITVLLFIYGCIVPVLTTPTRHEKKIPAEYNITVHEDKKLMVIVYSPDWVRAPANITSEITGELEEKLTEELKLEPENIILYENLKPKESLHSAPPTPEIGKNFGADLVLFAEVHEFALSKMIETDYYVGRITGRAAVFDADTGQRLWPDSEHGKLIRIAYDVEEGDYDQAFDRLVRSFAHCVTRYLYDCPVPKFKIFEDKSGTGWRDWQD